MKKQKVISVIVSAAAALGGLGAVPVSAAGGFEMPENYQFVDIAHHGDTYVAMVKENTSWTAAKLYTSVDGGMTWSDTRDIANAVISSNKQSQQQLLYWEDKGLFVAHCAGATLTSSDGTTWASNPNLHYESNGTITVSGDQLIINGTNCLIPTNDTENNKITENKIDTMGTSYPWAAAAKPADADGNITVLIQNQNKLCDVVIDIDNIAGSTVSEIASAEAIPNPKDMVYASGADQFLSIDASETLFVAKNSTTYSKLTVKEGTKVTAVAANDNYIVTGFADGTMYYTENAELTSNTAWTEIPAAGTPADEPIRKIELSADNSFVALSNTKVYKGNMSKYNPIDEYVDEHFAISDPYVTNETQENPFENVRLIGGAYSPTLNKYIVYGDTTVKLPNNEGKESYWGMIYVSDDGLNWRNVYQGYTFSKINYSSTEPDKISGYTEVRNGAVWWEKEGEFIVSASTMDHTGVSLVSKDGESWSAVLTQGNTNSDGEPAPEKDTGMPLNVDIAVGGDGNLYVGGSGRRVWKYTAWNKDSREETLLTDVISGQWYLNQLSVSNEADPAIFTYQNAEGAVKDNTTGTWKAMSNIASGGQITDSVYSANLNSFVAVSGSGHRTSIVGKDATVTPGPVVSGGVVCKAIDTNGEAFMLAAQDGNVYTAPDTADFASSTLTAIQSANGHANSLPLTNVFCAGDMFIATSTDNTNSDVLAISKNSETDSYEYVTVSSLSAPGEITPGSTVSVNVDVDNQMPEGCSFTMIAAIYDPDGRLIQSVTADKTVAEFTNTTETMDVAVGEDVPDGSSMRLFVWNNMQEMTPLTNVTAPF